VLKDAHGESLPNEQYHIAAQVWGLMANSLRAGDHTWRRARLGDESRELRGLLSAYENGLWAFARQPTVTQPHLA
jgi:hypothetical protein